MNEIYLYKKNPSNSEKINVGLSYPSTYYYGMSVLGFLSAYKEFAVHPHVCAQRIFTNSKALAFNPKQLDLLGFSCIFEYDILQILRILKKYDFNCEASKRKRKAPLIFAAGSVVTTNPEPFANFFDFIITGDGEGIANEITNVYLKNKHKSKKEILKALSDIEGIYVPSLYETKYSGKNISAFYPIEDNVKNKVSKRTSFSKECLYSPILSDKTFYANTLFMEIARGCPNSCKFCTAHYHNSPVRFFDIEYIKKILKKTVKHIEKVVFIGAMISLHPDFDEICMYTEKLKAKYNFKVEFSSMSFEKLSSYVPRLIDDKTISFSVECGSEKLRKKMNKNLSNEQIYSALDFYISKGITKFNLYFMVGVPFETEDDIDEYISFALHLSEKYESVKFHHIISTFIPKPGTPFEIYPRENNGSLNEKLSKIKNIFTTYGIETSMPIIHNDNFSALVSLGDRRLSSFIKYIFEKNIPLKNVLIAYRKFMNEYNAKDENTFKISHYANYIYRKKSDSEILPWEFMNYDGK